MAKKPIATGIEAIVCADIARRQEFGLKKYGVSVQDNPLPLRAWLQHAYEETLDHAVYLRRAMDEIDKREVQAEAKVTCIKCGGKLPYCACFGQPEAA